MPDLASLSRGFRDRYLSSDEVSAQLHAWARAWPELCRVAVIGRTAEERPIEVLVVGPHPDQARPAIWVDANMHAVELCGTQVALAFAESLLALHVEGRVPEGLAPHQADGLREVLAYVCPRISPDGAEKVLKTGAYVRSVPRDERPARHAARWVACDIDGDGEALLMRVEHLAGEFVESEEVPGLMLPRLPGDPGPWYKVWPEGRVVGGDGQSIPDPSFLADNQTDLNRNFPWSWMPEPVQSGAGAFPGSEPESRSLLEYASRLPHLFAWVNLHTFGGVFIRPLGDQPDTKLHPEDLALFRQLGAWAEELTGYPMVSGFEQFTYAPDQPIHGDLSDWAWHVRGALSWVVELWDLFEQVGLPHRGTRFVDRYTHLEREDLVALGRWDLEHNQGRCLRPWRKATHPQLGEVEVGGLDTRFGISNPPPERLAQVCDQHVAMLMRVASLAPRITARATARRLQEDLHEVTVEVTNTGYLPTWIASSTRALPHNEPLWAEALTDRVVGAGRVEVGHLKGWGRGRYGAGASLFFQRSEGSTSQGRARFVVQGGGEVRIRVGSCRMGAREVCVQLA